MDNKKISIIVPVFNEELVITKTYEAMKKVIDSNNINYELIFINDGSTDNTVSILKNICNKDRYLS